MCTEQETCACDLNAWHLATSGLTGVAWGKCSRTRVRSHATQMQTDQLFRIILLLDTPVHRPPMHPVQSRVLPALISAARHKIIPSRRRPHFFFYVLVLSARPVLRLLRLRDQPLRERERSRFGWRELQRRRRLHRRHLLRSRRV